MKTRENFRKWLEEAELGDSPDEARYRDQMIGLLDTREHCFRRTCFPAHFTASALLLNWDGSEALLTHHHFLDRWLQFGGHCDGEADTLAAALREAEEESGIPGLVPMQLAPMDLDIHLIPSNAKRGEPAHFHYDIRYLLRAPRDAVPQISDESKELRWFSPSEMSALTTEAGLHRLIRKWCRVAASRSE